MSDDQKDLTKQLDMMLDAFVQTFGFEHFFSGSHIQRVARDIGKMRGGKVAERIEADEAEQAQKLADEKRLKAEREAAEQAEYEQDERESYERLKAKYGA